jgi:hypothetical protein
LTVVLAPFTALGQLAILRSPPPSLIAASLSFVSRRSQSTSLSSLAVTVNFAPLSCAATTTLVPPMTIGQRPVAPAPPPLPVCCGAASSALARSSIAFARFLISSMSTLSLAVTVISTPLSTSLTSVFAFAAAAGQFIILPRASSDGAADAEVAAVAFAVDAEAGAEPAGFCDAEALPGFPEALGDVCSVGPQAASATVSRAA